MGLRERARQNSWILMGFIIGFYGNWFITVIEKLTLEDNFQSLLLGLSFLTLFGYLLELTAQKKTRRLSYILASAHQTFIYWAIIFYDRDKFSLWFIFIGLLFWVGIYLIQWFRIEKYER